MADVKTFLRDMADVRSVRDFVEVFGLKIARERGVQVAREWVEKTGSSDVPDRYLYNVAKAEGWPATGGDWRWHAYVEAACNELDRLAGRALYGGE